MAKEKIENLDEIVFAKRHKEYGAYYLRTVYKKYVTRSLLISCTALLLAAGIPFLIFKQAHSAKEDKTVSAEMTDLAKAPEDAPPPPPPPPPPEQQEQKVKFTAPIVTTDEVDDNVSLNQDDLNKNTNNAAPTDEIVVQETSTNTVIEAPQAPPVFTIVEEMPGYPGGEEARMKFMADNIKYPQMAKESGITGTVYITFVVDENGKVIDAKVLRGIGGGCDEEAVRVVKMMPNWVPGKQAGKAVRVQYNMPVKFVLN